MRKESWDEYHARLQANRAEAIQECSDPEKRRQLIEIHDTCRAVETAARIMERSR